MENQQQQPGITLNDIGGAVQAIDVAVSRGAFRAAEAASVGMLYNKLVEFLKANQQEAPANVAQGDTPPVNEDTVSAE
jgi:hypothetical protein